MTIHTALRQGTQLLERDGIDVPRLTAEVLLAHALHRDRTYLYAHPEQELRETEWIHYGRYLHERLKRKPTQYITRRQEFYGRSFGVTPDVLIPRPETEHLVEVALPLARVARRTVDVGTGSGAIAVTLALEGAGNIVGSDLAPGAIAVARENARSLAANVAFVVGDSLTMLAGDSVDLIVSNPPYIAESERQGLQPEVRDWEPAMALFADSAGLGFYRKLTPEAERVLHPGGSLIVEMGAGQSNGLADLLGSGWELVGIFPDLAGIDRVLHARKKT